MAETKADTISVTYRPGPGDPSEVEAYGQYFTADETIDIPAKHKDKILGNPYFEMKGEKKQEHRQVKPEEQEVATFEDNLLRERTEEYLENRQFTSSAPGDAERVARAQEQVAEMREAQESDDTDKPRRGRPPKDK